MFKPHPILRPLGLLAAGTSVLTASSVSAAPLRAEAPNASYNATSFADAGPGEKRSKRGERGKRAQAFQQGQPDAPVKGIV